MNQNESSKVIQAILVLIMLVAIAHLSVACSLNRPPATPVLAQQASHNVLSLEDTMSICLRQDVYELLKETYGDQLRTWAVQETGYSNFVYAFPLAATKAENEEVMNALENFIESYSVDAICDQDETFDRLFPTINTVE